MVLLRGHHEFFFHYQSTSSLHITYEYLRREKLLKYLVVSGSNGENSGFKRGAVDFFTSSLSQKLIGLPAGPGVLLKRDFGHFDKYNVPSRGSQKVEIGQMGAPFRSVRISDSSLVISWMCCVVVKVGIIKVVST